MGSIFEWANSGRAAVRDGEPVDEVHSFDEDWGRLLEESLRTPPDPDSGAPSDTRDDWHQRK